MRVIGMDIHRSFAQVAILEDGQIIRELRVDLVYGPLVNFAKTLSLDDEVVIEATGNSAAVERLMRPYVKRVAVANSRLVRVIAYARVKTDKIDAAVLARLHAAGFLPEVWVADEETLNRRRQIAERMGVLEQLVRLKGRIQAILHSNLIPKYSGHLFGKTGRKWLDSLPLPDEERAMLGRLIVELERVSAQMAELDKVLAQQAFCVRIQSKRGAAAAAVATARKLAVMIWHVLSRDAQYHFARPAFTAMKLRKVALKAGAPREYGKAGPGRDYWIKEIRHQEINYIERAERAYERMVAAWREKPKKTAGR